MKKLLSTFFIALALMVSVPAFAPVAHADAADIPTPGGTTSENLSSPMGKAMMVIMGIFAWLLGVAAITLDNAVYYTVVTMGDVVQNLAAVGVAWRILRDIGNIALIFGFLGIGISIILDTERLGYGKKMLPVLLFAAVTLNFSLFVSEAVIDVGNLFATQFYTQINGGTPAGKIDYGDFKNEGISNKLLSQLGLQTIYGNALGNGQVFEPGSSIVLGFMGIIVFMVTAFVFFSLAFILIARFVALIFLIIVAPIGFAGLAVPKLENTASQWWSTLFQQTITAPILMLMLYIALAVITDAHFLTGFGLANGGGDAAWHGFVGNQNLVGFAGILLSYAVAIGLLLTVTVLSKKLGAVGADYAMKMGGKASFGVTGYAMRRTVGAGSQRLARTVRSSKTFGSSRLAMSVASTLDRGAKASFDVRGTKALSSLPFGGVDAGKAQEGGFRKTQEDKAKRYKDYNDSRQKAIEEKGTTQQEEDTIVQAERVRENAEDAASSARQQLQREQQRQDNDPAIQQQKAEVFWFEEQARRALDDEKRLADQELIAAKDALRILETAAKYPPGSALAAAQERGIVNARYRLDAGKEAAVQAKEKVEKAKADVTLLSSPELDAARAAIAPDAAALKVAADDLAAATRVLEEAQKAEAAANKAANDRIGADKGRAQRDFAANLSSGPMGVGTNSAEYLAARALIRESRRRDSTAEKLIKELQNQIKADAKKSEEAAAALSASALAASSGTS